MWPGQFLFDERMKKYSQDTFELKSQLTPFEIIERLRNRTLAKSALSMVITDKDFIGRINQDSFEIIGSTYPLPYGATCTLKGTVNHDSTINLVTSLHKAFRILFLVWFIVLTVVIIVFSIIESAPINGLFAIIIGMPIAATLFRLFLHGMYVLARDKGLTKMKAILETAN